MKNALITCTLLILAIFTTAPRATADWRSTGGHIEIQLDNAGKLKDVPLATWTWQNQYPVGQAKLAMWARCLRRNATTDELVGKNKVTFKNLELASLESTKVAVFVTKKGKLKNGDTGWVSWNAQFMEPLVADGAALGSAEVQIKGKIGANEYVTCYFETWERAPYTPTAAAARERVALGAPGMGHLTEAPAQQPD